MYELMCTYKPNNHDSIHDHAIVMSLLLLLFSPTLGIDTEYKMAVIHLTYLKIHHFLFKSIIIQIFSVFPSINFLHYAVCNYGVGLYVLLNVFILS